jgi:DNA helicase-2/ATP-dependent DNA helicase PcrA
VTGHDVESLVANEFAVEEKYRQSLADRHSQLQGELRQLAPNTWTRVSPLDAARDGILIGRVALTEGDDEFLDGHRDFYIGTTHHETESYRVFSWAAPVACTYFRKSDGHHEWCDQVAAVRVLAHQFDEIVDLEDEIFVEEKSTDLFPFLQLQVPKAPRFPSTSATASPPPRTSPTRAEPVTQSDAAGTEVRAVEKLKESSPSTDVRVPDLLRRQLAAPKGVSMSSVLATLQPDQYDAIVKPASWSQVLQGHPGTGKTVIGAHRAAYLLNSWAPKESQPRGHVLLLGPTAEYVKHVKGVLRDLVDDSSRYSVRSVPSLLEELAGLPQSNIPTQSVSLQNVSQELARLIDQALANAKENSEGEAPRGADVYAELRWFVSQPPQEGLDGEWFQYLRALPETLGALKKNGISSYRGLLAYIGVRTNRTADPGHIIIDEAQDIHPIEWEILGRLGNQGGWTVLGDLNQRRTDHTFNSWNNVAELLGIEDDSGEVPLSILENGYRSTAQIIKFANQLLPSRERKLTSFQQDGEKPLITKVPSRTGLYAASLEAASDLSDEVGSGSIAVITVSPGEFRKVLVKREWQNDPADQSFWVKGRQKLRLLPPDRARGLEFDAVVVIEPADFPENFGRQGTLYTELTRANRKLIVVHNRALPQGMRL